MIPLTLALGLCITGISIWLGQANRGSLFHIMVTAFGVLLAPTLLPLLATLLFRRLSSNGVICGFTVGMACGILTLTAKTLYMTHIGETAAQTLDYLLEGYSIFPNITATCLAMILGSRFLTTSVDEQTRTADFFQRLDTPITAEEGHVSRVQSDSSSFIIRLSTLAVGALLIISGSIAIAPAARRIDISIGAILLVLGIPFRRLLRRRVVG